MSFDFSIRVAHKNDCQAISELVIRSARASIIPRLTSKGQHALLAKMAPESFVDFLVQGFHFEIAKSDSKFVGVVGIRPPSHLFHLFVDPDFHGNGIGRKLFETGLGWINANSPPDNLLPNVTVNSSLNSVAIYEHFGFQNQGEIQSIDDVTFQPMLLKQDPAILGSK